MATDERDDDNIDSTNEESVDRDAADAAREAKTDAERAAENAAMREEMKAAAAAKAANKKGPVTTEAKGKRTPKQKKEHHEHVPGAEIKGKGLVKFFREVKAEIKKVVTPTSKELWRYTGVVLGFLLIMMLFITVLDFFFGFGSSWLFGNGTSLFPEPAVEPAVEITPTPAG